MNVILSTESDKLIIPNMETINMKIYPYKNVMDGV